MIWVLQYKSGKKWQTSAKKFSGSEQEAHSAAQQHCLALDGEFRLKTFFREGSRTILVGKRAP